MIEDIKSRFAKIQEKQHNRTRKPQAKPVEKKATKRGGVKKRNQMAKYEMTEARKAANRVNFGTDQQKEDMETGHGFGMLGSAGTKLKYAIKKD